jgi:hypothetical protein
VPGGTRLDGYMQTKFWQVVPVSQSLEVLQGPLLMLGAQ